MKGGGSHKAYNSRTIGIGNKRPLSTPKLNMFHCVWVHFRNNKRHVHIHPEGRTVINNYGASTNRNRTKLFTDGASRAKEGYVDTVEAIGSEFLNNVVLVLEGEVLAGRALGGQHFDGAIGEVAVGQDGEELLTDGAGNTHDGEGGGVFLEGHADGELGGGGAAAEVGSGNARRRDELVMVSESWRLHFRHNCIEITESCSLRRI